MIPRYGDQDNRRVSEHHVEPLLAEFEYEKAGRRFAKITAKTSPLLGGVLGLSPKVGNVEAWLLGGKRNRKCSWILKIDSNQLRSIRKDSGTGGESYPL